MIFGLCNIAANSSSYNSQGNQKIAQTLTLNFLYPKQVSFADEENELTLTNSFALSTLTTNNDDISRASEFNNSATLKIECYQQSKMIIIPANTYKKP